MSPDQSTLDILKIERRDAPRVSRFWRWSVALVAAAAVAVPGAYWLLRERPIAVRTAVATVVADAPAGATILNASGYVVARREATVSSKVTGKIAEILIEEGMTVAEGQLLARLDDQTLRPQLALAERQLEARRKDLDEVQVRRAEAVRSLQRIERLRASDLASEQAHDAAQSEVAALEARLASLQSSIAVAEATVRVRAQDLEDLLVRAPFGGVIVSKDAQPGEMVSPVSAGGGFTRTGIATLVDMDSREIEVDVNEAFINRVEAGQPTEAVLDAYPDWTIQSHVINIVPTADRQKATVRVRIAFDELDPRILPNMGVKVGFLDAQRSSAASGPDIVATRRSVAVPAAALVREGATSYVWRLRDGSVERVTVSAGSERGGQIELASGINAGDIVVVVAPAGLSNGARVAAEE